MLDSRILDSYGTYLVAVCIVLGYVLVQNDVKKHKLSYLGVLLMIIAWLIFYDRSSPCDSKEDHHLWSVLSVMFTSALVLYCEILNKTKYLLFASMLFAVSWCYLIWVMSESDLSEEKTQYNIISTLLIILAVVYFVPRQRKEAKLYDIGIPLFAIGWTMLAATILDSPVNDCIIC